MGLHNKIDWPVDLMKSMYLEAEMTLQEIADHLGRDIRLVHKVLKKHGVPMRPRGWCNQRGERNVSWSGGRMRDKDGYILVRMPDHPDADSHGYVREHRLVAEKMLGRRLRPEEVVHHKNDNRSDNDPGNLRVFPSNAAHLAATLKGKAPRWTEEGRAVIAVAWQQRRKRTANAAPSDHR